MSLKLHLPRLKTEAHLAPQQTYRKSIFDKGILQDCHRTFRVCVPAFPECVNTVINELELLHFHSACAFSVCLVVAHWVFQCRTCKSIACGFLSLKSVPCRHLWHDVLSKDCVCSVNGISAYRRKKDLLQQKANIANPTNPLAWTGLFCTCLRCLVFADPRAKKCGQFIYSHWNAFKLVLQVQSEVNNPRVTAYGIDRRNMSKVKIQKLFLQVR